MRHDTQKALEPQQLPRLLDGDRRGRRGGVAGHARERRDQDRQREGWVLTTDGRINNFLSVTRGNWIPAGEPPYTGVDDAQTTGNQITSSRVRTGFIENILAFELNKQVTEATTSRRAWRSGP